MEALAGDHFFAGHAAFGLHFEADGHALRIDCLDQTADNFADLFLVMVKLRLAFGIANTLLNDLACGLGGDASKISRGAFDDHHAAQFCLGVHFLGFN